jgi:hypothetical protein
MVFTNNVFAKPGTPTNKQCPLLKIDIKTFFTVSSCPTITFAISLFSSLYLTTKDQLLQHLI